MKTKEQLSTLKEEFENLKTKLADLNDEELKQVTGGTTGSPKFINEEKGVGFIPMEDGCKDNFVRSSKSHPPVEK